MDAPYEVKVWKFMDDTTYASKLRFDSYRNALAYALDKATSHEAVHVWYVEELCATISYNRVRDRGRVQAKIDRLPEEA